jgi:SAM-dependent methyltransferase
MKFELDNSRVLREIAPDDDMAHGNLENYFALGESALLDCIAPALEASPKQRFGRILDLPCGYGRVMRYLRAAFPDSQITACDIQRAGVDFCAEKFGAIPVYSSEDPTALELPGPFNLIWCGSLLTHLDEERCGQWLDLFRSVLAPYGVFVFTTHGRLVAHRLQAGLLDADSWLGQDRADRMLQDFDTHGFGYQEYPAKDRGFDGQERGYGWGLSSPAWVVDRITERDGWRLVYLREAAWRRYQDVAACLAWPIDSLPPPLQERATALSGEES